MNTSVVGKSSQGKLTLRHLYDKYSMISSL